MANKKAKFRSDWMDPNLNPSFSEWLDEDEKNINNAKCKVCKTVFSLSNMGVQALKSHQNSVKHRQILTIKTKTVDIRSFTSKKDSTVSKEASDATRTIQDKPGQSTATEEISDKEHLDQNTAVTNILSGSNTLPCASSAIPSRVNLNTFLKSEQVKKGEVMWCIFTVLMHLSLRTSANAVKLFPKMFSDSNIANKFQLQKDKIAYTISYGLAPFYKNQLLSCIRKLQFFNISFDESLNKVSQNNQMDIIIRYWCPEENKVSTRYLTSVFLGHSRASDLLDAFEKELSTEINLQNILQISMDGPSVNWKFLKELEETIQVTPESKKFINLGSCGLHVIHNAFKTGINSTGWNTVSFLRGIYNIFKNVPARRADFIRCSGSTVFPKKFCAVRWLSNASVAERAITIVPYLSIYIHKAKEEKCLPNTFSMNNVEKAIENALLPAQLAFFQSLASELEPFLTKYQSDRPLAPFLHDTICNLLKSLMSRFVKEEILDAATSSAKLAKIDVEKSENLKPAKYINLGYETRIAIRNIKNSHVVSDCQILQFRQECRRCLINCTKKILEKSPLKYKMTKGVSCLMPVNILNSKLGLECIKQALEVLTDNKWFSGVAADSIERSYISFCSNPLVINVCKNFDSQTDRLDEIFAPMLKHEKNEFFVTFVKMILTLYHGNAAVERGFSVNKDCLIENLRNESLVAQRIVYDATSCFGGIENIEISKDMLQYVSQSNEKWKDALRRKKIQQETLAENKRKRKIVMKQIEELKANKKKILEESSSHLSAFDKEIEGLEKALKN